MSHQQGSLFGIYPQTSLYDWFAGFYWAPYPSTPQECQPYSYTWSARLPLIIFYCKTPSSLYRRRRQLDAVRSTATQKRQGDALIGSVIYPLSWMWPRSSVSFQLRSHASHQLCSVRRLRSTGTLQQPMVSLIAHTDYVKKSVTSFLSNEIVRTWPNLSVSARYDRISALLQIPRPLLPLRASVAALFWRCFSIASINCIICKLLGFAKSCLHG